MLPYMLVTEPPVLQYLKPPEEFLLPRGVTRVIIVQLKEMAESAQHQGLPETPRAQQHEPVGILKERIQVPGLVSIVQALLPEGCKILLPHCRTQQWPVLFFCVHDCLPLCFCHSVFCTGNGRKIAVRPDFTA